jgi:hypothetical protein
MEKLDDKFSRMIESVSKKSDDKMDAFKLISLIRDGEERGMSQLSKIMELAEMKAETMRESSDDSKEGLLTKALSSFIPLIANASNAAQQQQQALMAQPGRSLNRPQPARPIPQSQQRQAQPRSPQAPNPNRAAKAQSDGQVQKPNQGLDPLGTTVIGKKPIDTSPSDHLDDVKIEMEESIMPEIIESPELALEPDMPLAEGEVYVEEPEQAQELSLEELTNQATEAQMGMVSAALPTIAEAFETKELPESTASKIVATLKSQGYTSEQILSEFSIELIVQLAKSLGKGDNESISFLRSMYASIEAAAKIELGNQQHGERQGQSLRS